MRRRESLFREVWHHDGARVPRQNDHAPTVKCAREIMNSFFLLPLSRSLDTYLSLSLSLSLSLPHLVPPVPQLRLINLSLFFNEVDAEERALCDKGETKRELHLNAIVDCILLSISMNSSWLKVSCCSPPWKDVVVTRCPDDGNLDWIECCAAEWTSLIGSSSEE